MGAIPGSLPVFQQMTEAFGSVVNHNALKIELFFKKKKSGSISHMLQILIYVRSILLLLNLQYLVRKCTDRLSMRGHLNNFLKIIFTKT